jgi:GDP/UDP-N,N'-diacetylbacillosamine 2-epimerase (hydrolysing)
MNRRVCVVTGTRADYGLLRWVIDGIAKSPTLDLQLVATGMHLSSEFGLTYREIEGDGYTIDAKVEMLLSSDSAASVAKSMGLGMIGFADVFERLRPDVVVLLGDRFEILAAASAALVARIPIAHLHGGETTEGAFDEAIRHAVTKMSHLHFVAAEPYRQRVIQLGEHPDRVHLVGGLGVDAIRRVPLLDRAALEASLDFRFGERNLLVTFHPVTLESRSVEQQMDELLAALDALPDTRLIITLPNADNGGRTIIHRIEAFVASHPNARAYTSLGQLRYLSCLRQVDAVVGNSSSGLAEAPSMGIGTINIGDRQRGRLRAASVIDCEPDRHDILRAIDTSYSADFRITLATVANPYGDGGASARIVKALEIACLSDLVKKAFHDLPSAPAASPA